MRIRLSDQPPIAGGTARGCDHNVTQRFETASFFDDTVWPPERPIEAREGDGRQDERSQQNPRAGEAKGRRPGQRRRARARKDI